MEKGRCFARSCTVLFLAILSGFIFLSQSSYAANLLINPGAETGDLTGWTPEPSNFWVAGDTRSPHDGTYLFWPGNGDLAYGTLSQEIAVSTHATSIDNGVSWLHLSGWMENWDQYPHDRATMAIMALDDTGNQLAYFSRDHRSPSWGFYKIDERIPPGTRTLKVVLIATRFVGSNDDGYFDTISLEVDENQPAVFVTVSSPGGTNTIANGASMELTAATTGGTDSGYTWSSSFEGVATVDAAAVVATGIVSGHRPGRAVIQARGNQTGATGSMEIMVYDNNGIMFTAPDGNATLLSGSTTTVSWTVQGTPGIGELSFSSTGGSSWSQVAANIDLSTGQYSWKVPDTTVPLNDCLLKMTWSGGESSSAYFSVGAAPVAGSISGVIVTSIAGYGSLPVKNATITVVGNGQTATTDDTGSFQLPSLATGDYSLQITSPGLSPVTTNASVTAPANTDIGTITMQPLQAPSTGSATTTFGRANVALNATVLSNTPVVSGTVAGIDDGSLTPFYSYQHNSATGKYYCEFVIDLSKSYTIDQIDLWVLQSYGFTISTSENNVDWTMVKTMEWGAYASTGISIPFASPFKGRYIKYYAWSSWPQYVGVGDIVVYESGSVPTASDPGFLGTDNIAKGKQIVQNLSAAAVDHSAGNAIDGDPATSWIPIENVTDDDTGKKQYSGDIVIDLGKEFALGKVILKMKAYHATTLSFPAQAADIWGKQWLFRSNPNLFTTESTDSGDIAFTLNGLIRSRYMTIHVQTIQVTNAKPEISEVEVYEWKDGTSSCPDADGDGVSDALDNCPQTPASIPVYANGCPSILGDFNNNKKLDLGDCLGILKAISAQ